MKASVVDSDFFVSSSSLDTITASEQKVEILWIADAQKRLIQHKGIDELKKQFWSVCC